MALIPAWKNLSHNCKPGIQHGQRRALRGFLRMGRTRCSTAPRFSHRPTSWSVIYDPKYKGQITVPDNPIQIADAALYLSKTDPSLGITDPYELTQPQMDAVSKLLKSSRAHQKYWHWHRMKSSSSPAATPSWCAWPYQTNTLQAAKVPVADTIPPKVQPAGPIPGWSPPKPRTPTAPMNGSTG